MTTLVTGAAGFLGSHVARQLVARGETVRVLVRASSSNRAISDLSLEYVTGDLRDAASLERAMAGVKRVYHVAADYRLWAKRSQDIYDSNVGGTKNLLAAAKRAGVEQLIYTSTVATIAVDRLELPNEFTDAKLEEMVGHYKRSKWMAEREALQAALSLGLVDVFRRFEQPPRSYSWWDYRAGAFQRNNGLRIDLLLATPALAERCTACTIDREPRRVAQASDHAPVIGTFDI